MGRAVFPPLFDLRPNYDGGNEDNGNLFQKVPCTYCCIQCPQHCSRPPPPTPLSETSGYSRESLSQSLVGLLPLSPGSWGAQGFFCALQESVAQSCVSSGSSVVGFMPTSSQRAYSIPRSTATRAPALQQSTADPYVRRRHSNTVLSQSLWGVWVLVHTSFVWAFWASLAVFDSELDLAPPAILLGLFLCP